MLRADRQCSELTARTNDEGWQTVFVEWLKEPAVGQGRASDFLGRWRRRAAKNISANLVSASISQKKFARRCSASSAVTAATLRKSRTRASSFQRLTPTMSRPPEAFQAVIWHLLVSHPKLKTRVDEMGKHTVNRDGLQFFLDGTAFSIGQSFETAAIFALKARRGRALADVEEAATFFRPTDFFLIVVTNQPEVGRGTVDRRASKR